VHKVHVGLASGAELLHHFIALEVLRANHKALERLHPLFDLIRDSRFLHIMLPRLPTFGSSGACGTLRGKREFVRDVTEAKREARLEALRLGDMQLGKFDVAVQLGLALCLTYDILIVLVDRALLFL